MNTPSRPLTIPPAESGHVCGAGAEGGTDQEAVLAELGRTASLRIIDLMDRTGMPRARVRAALDALRASGHVQAFAMGSRYSVRKPCAGGLSAVGHIA